MKDYTSDSPQFSDSISIVETTDTNHADNINAAAKQLIANDLVLRDNADTHTATTVTSESGVHGIRYYGDTIQCYDEESESWEEAAGSTITDDTTGEKYKLGIDNGLLYYEAVEEEEAE